MSDDDTFRELEGDPLPGFFGEWFERFDRCPLQELDRSWCARPGNVAVGSSRANKRKAEAGEVGAKSVRRTMAEAFDHNPVTVPIPLANAISAGRWAHPVVALGPLAAPSAPFPPELDAQSFPPALDAPPSPLPGTPAPLAPLPGTPAPSVVTPAVSLTPRTGTTANPTATLRDALKKHVEATLCPLVCGATCPKDPAKGIKCTVETRRCALNRPRNRFDPKNWQEARELSASALPPWEQKQRHGAKTGGHFPFLVRNIREFAEAELSKPAPTPDEVAQGHRLPAGAANALLAAIPAYVPPPGSAESDLFRVQLEVLREEEEHRLASRDPNTVRSRNVARPFGQIDIAAAAEPAA